MSDPFSREQMRLYTRSFVDWAQSPIGFYVNQHWDGVRWVKKWAPIKFYETQERLLRYLYTIGEDGLLPWQEVWVVDIGKSAKSMIQAAVAQWFGMMIDRDSEVLLAANSKDQSQVRCFQQLRDSVGQNPFSAKLVDALKSELTFSQTGNVAKPVPMKSTTVAGSNAVFLGFDEIWGYTGARAAEMMAEMKESPTRQVSHTLVTTYPPFLEDAGPANDVLSYFFDEDERPVEENHIEPVEGMEDLPLWVCKDTSQAVYWNHEPLPWHTRTYASGVTFLDRQRKKPGTSYSHYLRIWEARRVHREDTFTTEARWDACEDDGLTALHFSSPREPVVGAVDIGVKGDTSGLVARAYNVLRQTLDLRYHAKWEPLHYAVEDRMDIIGDVQERILRLHRQHELIACYYDPSQFMHAARELERLGVRMIEFTQNTMRIAADTAYRNWLLSQVLRHYVESYDLKQHVMHGVAVERGNGTIRLDKRKTSAHIDLAVADSMACWGAMEHRQDFIRYARRGRTAPPLQRTRRVNWNNVYGTGTS